MGYLIHKFTLIIECTQREEEEKTGKKRRPKKNHRVQSHLSEVKKILRLLKLMNWYSNPNIYTYILMYHKTKFIQTEIADH